MPRITLDDLAFYSEDTGGERQLLLLIHSSFIRGDEAFAAHLPLLAPHFRQGRTQSFGRQSPNGRGRNSGFRV